MDQSEVAVLATPAIGEAFQGGFYAGRIRVGADLFALIVSPKANGDFRSTWHPSYTTIAGAGSRNDGMANTVAMAEAGSPLAKSVQALEIGGHTDWYAPSRDELEMLYRAFKPSEEENYAIKDGTNPSSEPCGEEYTETSPTRTDLAEFQEDGEQAFETAWYWTSTQCSAYNAWYQGFDDGSQFSHVKGYGGRVRAVRRFKLNP